MDTHDPFFLFFLVHYAKEVVNFPSHIEGQIRLRLRLHRCVFFVFPFDNERPVKLKASVPNSPSLRILACASPHICSYLHEE